MEVAFLVLVVFIERARPDLVLRRLLARLPLPRPASSLRVPAPVALAGVDIRRLLPRLATALAVYALYRIFLTDPAYSAYETVNRLVGLSLAFLGLATMAIVAATAARDRGQDLLAALPRGPRTIIVGWTFLLTILAVAVYTFLLVLRYRGTPTGYADLLPNAWELAQGPLLILGGGMLGLLLARLVPAWVATPVSVVLGTGWVLVLSAGDSGSTTMLAPVVEWIQYNEGGPVTVEPGSLAWHNVYLLGLCGLGLVTALLREAGRRAALIVVGSTILAGTVAAGVLAMP